MQDGSKRSFSRRNAEATGLTPVHAGRASRRRRLLAESRLPAKRIPQRCAFRSEENHAPQLPSACSQPRLRGARYPPQFEATTGR
jgi:AraC-like DNA-binding protein